MGEVQVTIHLPPRDITLRHLVHLTDDRGILEHAKGATPQYAHGYCVDDNARLLIVTARDRSMSTCSSVLQRIALRFLLHGQSPDGAMHNRLSFERIWLDDPSVRDCWGRSVWAFGVAAAVSTDGHVRRRSLHAFEKSARLRSPFLRSMCFAALGAYDILRLDPDNEIARSLLSDTAEMIRGTSSPTDWPWPESRLVYANAIVPDALVAAGFGLHDNELLRDGIGLLEWLVETETFEGHYSVTPTLGRGPLDEKPAFDQQPIEVAALAEASARVANITQSPVWTERVQLGVDWFLGRNDAGLVMIDFDTGGGYDGLHKDAVNINQGAESTLAMIATMQLRNYVQHG